ncbi:hypothetical protein MXB_2194 [Myxobolus squamalis]|nr:hypothetical protein MXB_2194 [Myxobolus squamalis]
MRLLNKSIKFIAYPIKNELLTCICTNCIYQGLYFIKPQQRINKNCPHSGIILQEYGSIDSDFYFIIYQKLLMLIWQC